MTSRSWGEPLKGLAGVAFRGAALALLCFGAGGLVLGIGAWYAVRDLHWGWGALVAFLALAEGVAAGVVLAGKWAVSAAAAHALRTLRLGAALVGALFDHMPGRDRLQEGLGRLPLARAEGALRSAVVVVTGEASGGWLRRSVQHYLLERVSHYTLARFREADARQGGIDLSRVKEALQETIDDALARKVESAGRTVGWLVGLGLVGLVVAQTWLLARLVGG